MFTLRCTNKLLTGLLVKSRPHRCTLHRWNLFSTA